MSSRDDLIDALTTERFSRHVRTTTWTATPLPNAEHVECYGCGSYVHPDLSCAVCRVRRAAQRRRPT